MSKNKRFKVEVDYIEKAKILKLLKSFGTTMSVYGQKNTHNEHFIFFSIRNLSEINQIQTELRKEGKEIEAV